MCTVSGELPENSKTNAEHGVCLPGCIMQALGAWFGPKQSAFHPMLQIETHLILFEVSGHLYPCVTEVGLGDYKWCEGSSYG